MPALAVLTPYTQVATDEGIEWQPLVAVRYPLAGFSAQDVPELPITPDAIYLSVLCDSAIADHIAADPDIYVLERTDG